MKNLKGRIFGRLGLHARDDHGATAMQAAVYGLMAAFIGVV